MNGAYPELARERPADPDRHPRGGGAVPPEPGERPEAAQRHLPQDQGRRLRHDRRRRDAFDLHATYGIPVEVTESLAADQNLRVDMAGFETAAEEHSADLARDDRGRRRLRHRPARHAQGSYHHGSEFLGYADDRGRGEGDRHPRAGPARRVGRPVATAGPPIVLVLDRTPFYGESRRPGRRHRARSGATGSPSRSSDTKKDNDFTLHIGRVTEGTVTVERAGARPRSTPTAARRSAGPTRRRTSCTTPCTRTWASTPSRPAARSSPTGSGSTSPTPRPSAASGSERSRRRSTRWS